jgi:hypothetical protein
MSSLKRSTTYVNGQLREEGKSISGINTSNQQVIANQINPYKDKENWSRLSREQSLLGDTWLNSKNTTTDDRSFNEFKAQEGARWALGRLTRGGKRRRSLRKYKKSKRVFRKKSRSTRRR